MIKRIFIFILLFSLAVAGNAQPVPLGDRVYELFDQASLRGLLQGALPEHRPFTRLEVADLLIRMENNRTLEDRVPLAIYLEMRQQIEAYKREIIKIAGEDWWKALPPYKGRIKRYVNKAYPYKINESLLGEDGKALHLEYENGQWLTLDPSYVLQYDSEPEQEDVFRRRWGFVFEAGPVSWMTVYLRWRDVVEWGREPYLHNVRDNIFDDRIGFINPNAVDNISYEDLIGGLQLQHGPISLLFGRDQVRWGPGRFGNLMFSGESAPFSQGRLRIDIGKTIHFTALNGALVTYPELRDVFYTAPSGWLRTVRRSKYLAAHRLEVSPRRWITVGLQETVVYGERAFDFAYLNPVSVYFTDEHENGDQDNALMGGDIRLGPWHILPQVVSGMAWGELLLDDFRFSKVGTDYYGNKLAWLGGVSLATPGGYFPVETGYEYTRLRPYVYTHIYPVNVYKHWNAPLGMQLQPNSDRSVVWMSWWLRQHWRFGLEGYYLRHGENIQDSGNVGGDIDTPHHLNDPEEAPFLDGTPLNQSRGLIWIEWEAFEGLVFTTTVGYDKHIDQEIDGIFMSVGLALNRPEDRRWSLRGR